MMSLMMGLTIKRNGRILKNINSVTSRTLYQIYANSGHTFVSRHLRLAVLKDA